MKYRIQILLLMLAMMIAGVMPLQAKEQYVDPVFGDTIDRTAEDFVTVSLLVADPGKAVYSTMGHSCLRMQCPTFGLDYCFSYESEDVTTRFWSFIASNLYMGLFAIPAQEYCDGYRQEGRGVYEYKLNLPADVEQNLWRILDNQVAEGSLLQYDYLKRGCTIACVKFVHEALGETPIVYDASLYEQSPTGRDLVRWATKDALWMRFFVCFIAGSAVDVPLHGEKQLLVPADLVDAWKKATIKGEPLMAQEPNVLVEGVPQSKNGWFTPLVAMLLILCLSIANLFWSKPYFDWLMLAVQTAIGAFMMYLIFISDLCHTSWNWLIVPFNILPALAWYWRKWWSLAYACALLIWCGIMAYVAIWGHVLVDWPHIVLVLAWVMVLVKQSTSQLRTIHALFTHNRRTISAQ